MLAAHQRTFVQVCAHEEAVDDATHVRFRLLPTLGPPLAGDAGPATPPLPLVRPGGTPANVEQDDGSDSFVPGTCPLLWLFMLLPPPLLR